MNKNRITLAVVAILAAGVLLAIAIVGLEPVGTHEHDAPESEAHAEEAVTRGPHNGRLLRDGDFAIELAIFEEGVPPEYRAWASRDDKPVAPQQVVLTVQVARLGGDSQTFKFSPAGDALRGQGNVEEPHSFDVTVTASHAGKTHSWRFASYEGRTTIPAEVAKSAGITTAIAGPAEIRDILTVTGRVTLDPTRSAQVRPRFAGVLRELRKGLGDAVARNEIVAMIESNESLQAYAVRSPIDGVVVAQNASQGELVGEAAILEISDVSQVVAELHVAARDGIRLKPGQPVEIAAVDGEIRTEAVISRVLPVTDILTQTIPARVLLANPDGNWRPGRLIEARITTSTRAVPLAVRTDGLQRFRDFDVVFAQVGDVYEVRMLKLGANDGTQAEVLGGLEPGTAYVDRQSFLIKADIEKAGASHSH